MCSLYNLAQKSQNLLSLSAPLAKTIWQHCSYAYNTEYHFILSQSRQAFAFWQEFTLLVIGVTSSARNTVQNTEYRKIGKNIRTIFCGACATYHQ